MIPNLVASKGPWAGLWTHLNSIDFSLERIENLKNDDDYYELITELDRDRLKALIELLCNGLESEKGSTSNVFYPYEEDYLSAGFFTARFISVPEVTELENYWGLNYKDTMIKLIDTIKSFESSFATLIKMEYPDSEFSVARSIVRSLLLETETVLNSAPEDALARI